MRWLLDDVSRSARMARHPRTTSTCARYYLTRHGNNQQKIFLDETDRQNSMELFVCKALSQHQ